MRRDVLFDCDISSQPDNSEWNRAILSRFSAVGRPGLATPLCPHRSQLIVTVGSRGRSGCLLSGQSQAARVDRGRGGPCPGRCPDSDRSQSAVRRTVVRLVLEVGASCSSRPGEARCQDVRQLIQRRQRTQLGM